jgi:hypothetical protein
MLVFWNEKLVFLAVPKTGTTAWQQALGPRASMAILDPPHLKHAPLYRYNRFVRPLLEDAGGRSMETLAVVREPLDWLGSWYRYRRRPFMDGQPNSTAGMSFDAFVQEYLRGKPAAFAQVGSQARFLAPLPNGLRVDHLFQYEQPDALAAFLTARLGPLPARERLNVSPDAPLEISDRTREKFHRKRPEEFDVWQAARR